MLTVYSSTWSSEVNYFTDGLKNDDKELFDAGTFSTDVHCTGDSKIRGQSFSTSYFQFPEVISKKIAFADDIPFDNDTSLWLWAISPRRA